MIQRNTSMVSGLVVAALVAGCSSGDPLAESPEVQSDDAPVVEESYGAVAAGVVAGADPEAEQVQIQAQFLNARGVTVESALEALEVWSPQRGLESGECRAIETTDDQSGQDPVSLHLLDVGDLHVETTREEVSIRPRELPDLLNSFHGVVYGSEWSEEPGDASVVYHPGETYRFFAEGSSEIEGFDVTVQAPRPVQLVAADGHEIEDRQSVAVAHHQDLEVVWETDGSERGDVYLDLSAGAAPEATRVQCRSDDAGAFSIPVEQLQLFDDRARLDIRRVHHNDAGVDGLDELDFFFAAGDHVELVLD